MLHVLQGLSEQAVPRRAFKLESITSFRSRRRKIQNVGGEVLIDLISLYTRSRCGRVDLLIACAAQAPYDYLAFVWIWLALSEGCSRQPRPSVHPKSFQWKTYEFSTQFPYVKRGALTSECRYGIIPSCRHSDRDAWCASHASSVHATNGLTYEAGNERASV